MALRSTISIQAACFGVLLFVVSGQTQTCNCPDNTCPARCQRLGSGDGWVQFRNSCYKFKDDVAYTHSIIGHDCFISRADALSIDDKEEDEFIRSYAKRLFKYPTNINASFWTSGAASTKGVWFWEYGANMTYTNWYPGQPQPFKPEPENVPRFGNEHCLALVGEDDFTWHDIPCNRHMHTICEINLDSVQPWQTVG